MSFQLKCGLMILAFVTLGWTSIGFGQTSQPTGTVSPADQDKAGIGDQGPAQQSPGSINGTIVDQSGAVVAGARVTLTAKDHSLNQEVVSGVDGQFFFAKVAPGPFQLTSTSAGFATQTYSGVLHAGDVDTVPPIVLAVATNVTEVQVGVSPVEVAEEQLKIEEKQRVLGAIPNFYVTYIPNAAPMTSKQKFKLAWKTVVDPFTLVFVGGVAGVQQAQDHFKGYGQGAQGYGKRFGAGYADTVTGTFIGSAILPSLLKQDPRYFYKGTGSKRSRALYAIANSVICKGDNGRWQPSYSNILGSLAAGGISNLYYPAQDRDGVELTFENAAIGIGGTAATNLLQEFVIRKLTPKLNHNSATPDPTPKK
ncbi:MAG: carboxypeptidase-like regulatory domain-containing protein [Terriglobales bacterium]